MLTRTRVNVLVTVLVAGLLTVLTGASAQAAYSPRPGPLFNNPYGTPHVKNRILAHIRNSIEHAPGGSTVQLAAYSFDRPDLGDAIVAAYHRGVHVQLVLNDNWVSKQTERLSRVLGTDIGRRSFVKICYESCRGGAGNLHSKFYLFSRTGAVRNVVMVGSANLTGYAAKSQFNDMFTFIGRATMRRHYETIFGQLARDRRLAHPWRVYHNGTLTSRFYPHPDTTPRNDPVMRRLNQITCKAKGHTGFHGHTLLRISRYGWQGDRGLWLAKKVAGLRRHGCGVRVIVSSAGRRIVGTLKRAGVLVRSADVGLRSDGTYRKYTHEKWMIVNGTFGGVGGRTVWTGSENWSNMALRNDEVTVQIPWAHVYYDYARHFDAEWKYHVHRLPQRPPPSSS